MAEYIQNIHVQKLCWDRDLKNNVLLTVLTGWSSLV